MIFVVGVNLATLRISQSFHGGMALDSADGYSHQIMTRPHHHHLAGSDIPSGYFPNQILFTTLQSFVRWQRESADFSTLSKLCPLKALNCVTKLQATCSASQFCRKRKYHGREIRHQKFFAIFFLGIPRCVELSEYFFYFYFEGMELVGENCVIVLGFDVRAWGNSLG